MSDGDFQIERKGDGRLIVRIRSAEYRGTRPPDAVFSFRAGDPQYEQWEVRWRDQATSGQTNSSAR